jgi:hypothetical protein
LRLAVIETTLFSVSGVIGPKNFSSIISKEVKAEATALGSERTAVDQ